MISTQTDVLRVVSETVNGVDMKLSNGKEGLFEAQKSAGLGLIELYEVSSVEETYIVPVFFFVKMVS